MLVLLEEDCVEEIFVLVPEVADELVFAIGLTGGFEEAILEFEASGGVLTTLVDEVFELEDEVLEDEAFWLDEEFEFEDETEFDEFKFPDVSELLEDFIISVWCELSGVDATEFGRVELLPDEFDVSGGVLFLTVDDVEFVGFELLFDDFKVSTGGFGFFTDEATEFGGVELFPEEFDVSVGVEFLTVDELFGTLDAITPEETLITVAATGAFFVSFPSI
jgi:hypothetical protein